VANRSWSLGSIDRAWRTHAWHARASVFLAVLLRWQELRHGRRLKPHVSNKAILPFSWRLGASMLYRRVVAGEALRQAIEVVARRRWQAR
jgi:hypothetical protein